MFRHEKHDEGKVEMHISSHLISSHDYAGFSSVIISAISSCAFE